MSEDSFTIKKSTLWMCLSFILFILLLVALFTNVFVFIDKESISDDKKSADDKDKITFIEFSDFQCPFCKRYVDNTYAKIIAEYGDKIDYQFKYFPLSNLHKNAQEAAEAAECAKDQDKFWEYHDVLFKNQDALSVADLKKYAGNLGLDQSEFDSCLDSGEKAGIVSADLAEGKAVGVSGTPSFLIGGELFVGAQPFEKFQEVIDRRLRGEEAPPAPEPSQPQKPSKPKIVDVSIDDDAVKGQEDAPVTIIEFSDFQCPFCGRHFKQTLPKLIEEYIDTGKVKYVFRDFPLSFHKQAQKASEAAECAGDQGKFWEMHDKLYENQNALSVDDLKGYAADLGLDTTEFNDCLDSGKNEQEIKDDIADGKAAGVTGTPAFFINGEFLKGAQPFEAFQKVIDSKLEQ